MKLLVVLSCVAAVLAAPPADKKNDFHMKNVYVNGPHLNVHPGPRIINGHEAVPHSIPYQVWITQEDGRGNGWLCGGTLISSKYVLTAGHCGDGAISAEVLLGAHNITRREPTQVTIKAKSIKVHEKFDITEIINDISVYELETEAPFNANIQPVTLPSRRDLNNTYAGKTGKVSGWGLTDGFGSEVSSVLNYVEDKIITNAQCTDEFDLGDDVLHDSNICLTGQNDRGSCNGDSGGPLTVDGKQVGIVSFGINYCYPGYPSAFTRVTDYLDWIEKNTDVVIV